jgi:hypothetical protein
MRAVIDRAYKRSWKIRQRVLMGVLPNNDVVDFPLLFEEGWLRDQEKAA